MCRDLYPREKGIVLYLKDCCLFDTSVKIFIDLEAQSSNDH